jgi:hypothetical protein
MVKTKPTGYRVSSLSGSFWWRALALSGDGRFIAVGSGADNLLPGDTNNRSHAVRQAGLRNADHPWPVEIENVEYPESGLEALRPHRGVGQRHGREVAEVGSSEDTARGE